jgi:hypothetical protein
LEAFLRLRAEVFEIDTRFAEVRRGIFAALDGAGVLDHAVAGVDRIAAAMTEPPAVGRARVRGRAIRKLQRRRGRYLAAWNMVYRRDERHVLDLDDPFETEEKWFRNPRGCEAGAVNSLFERAGTT